MVPLHTGLTVCFEIFLGFPSMQQMSNQWDEFSNSVQSQNSRRPGPLRGD